MLLIGCMHYTTTMRCFAQSPLSDQSGRRVQTTSRCESCDGTWPLGMRLGGWKIQVQQRVFEREKKQERQQQQESRKI